MPSRATRLNPGPFGVMTSPRYATGEELHIGDRLIADGMTGTVVCVIQRREYSSECPESVWSYLQRGFMFMSDAGVLIHFDRVDECCTRLVCRGPTPN